MPRRATCRPRGRISDVGGADAGTGNSYTFNFTQSVTLNQQLYAVNLQGGVAGSSTLKINGNNATLSVRL